MELHDRFSTLFDQFLENWKQLEPGSDPAVVEQVQSLATALRAALKPVENKAIESFNKDTLHDLEVRVSEHFDEYADLFESPAAVGLPAGPTRRATDGDDDDDADSNLQQFLEDISTSVIDTQKGLNQQSIDYIKGLDELERPIPPSHFAIPSLKAQLTMGFRKSVETGLNVVLFSRKRQKEEYGESTVTFELAAIPPPPGAMAPVPPPSLFVIGAEKEKILDRARTLAEQADRALGATYERTRDRALVLRRSPTEASPTRFVVIWPAQKSGTKEGRWFELSVLPLVGEGDEIELAEEGAFFHDQQLAQIVSANRLLGISGSGAARMEKLAELNRAELNEAALSAADAAARLADAINGIALFVHEWLRQQSGAGAGQGTLGTE